MHTPVRGGVGGGGGGGGGGGVGRIECGSAEKRTRGGAVLCAALARRLLLCGCVGGDQLGRGERDRCDCHLLAVGMLSSGRRKWEEPFFFLRGSGRFVGAYGYVGGYGSWRLSLFAHCMGAPHRSY